MLRTCTCIKGAVVVGLIAALTPGLWAQSPQEQQTVTPPRGTDAPTTAQAQGGVQFFGNQAQFEAAVKAAGKVLKGKETYPWSAGAGSVIGVDDSLDVNTSVPGWIQPGILLDNVTYQSNLDPFGANGPNPRGGTGLALFTTGFIGATSNGLVANHFVDSLDILSGPPAGDNHTALGMQVVSFNNSPGGSSITVSVYDKDDNLIGQAPGLSDPANQGGAFCGILSTSGETIGRVNLYDTNPGFDAEGLINLTVYVAGGEPCPWDLDGGGDVGVGDLLILLANWANPYGVPDLLRMLAAWGPCP